MVAVKKVGFSEDILPTREEINSVHSFRNALLNNRVPVFHVTLIKSKLVKEKKVLDTLGVNKGFFDIDVPHHYLAIPEVDYINQSKYLSEMRENNFYTTGQGYSLERIFGLWGSDFDNPGEMITKINDLVRLAEDEPIKLLILGSDRDWIYKGIHYSTDGPYTDEEFKLLILEEFDKERRKFERLKKKFSTPDDLESSRSRPRIPEDVRIQVWRRDGGKCVRCGSRENLEYDHIIPISKGGSNTSRNIELLCQCCNRTKGNKVE